MQSVRRISNKLLPSTIVRDSAALNPVASIAEVETLSFADVMARVGASQSFDGGNASQQQASESRIDDAKPKKEKAKEKAGAVPRAISMLSPDNSIDLCVRLETMLQHKSLLIAVA